MICYRRNKRIDNDCILQQFIVDRKELPLVKKKRKKNVRNKIVDEIFFLKKTGDEGINKKQLRLSFEIVQGHPEWMEWRTFLEQHRDSMGMELYEDTVEQSRPWLNGGILCRRDGYRRWFPMLLSDNHLEFAGLILTAGE